MLLCVFIVLFLIAYVILSSCSVRDCSFSSHNCCVICSSYIIVPLVYVLVLLVLLCSSSYFVNVLRICISCFVFLFSYCHYPLLMFPIVLSVVLRRMIVYFCHIMCYRMRRVFVLFVLVRSYQLHWYVSIVVYASSGLYLLSLSLRDCVFIFLIGTHWADSKYCKAMVQLAHLYNLRDL